MKKLFSTKNPYKFKSIIIKWAASYALILLIPNLFFLYSYQITVHTVQKEIRSANELVLSNLQENIDKLLSDEKEAYSYVYSTKQFSDIKKYTQNSASFRYDVSSFVQSLGAYTVNNNANIEMLIYFKDFDYLITDSTANESSFLYASQEACNMPTSYDDWLALLQRNYSNTFFLSSDLQIGSSEPCILYANTINRSSQDINIFISIPLSVISEYTRNLSDRSLMITDSSGNRITVFGNDFSVDFLDLSLPSGSQVFTLNDDSYIFMYSKSSQTDWCFSIITPETNFWQTAQSLRLLFIGSFLVSLLLGIMLAWLLLRRNYKPIGSILNIIKSSDASGNEFDLIRNSYKKLENENRDMQSTLTKQAEQLRERYILSRLKGRKSQLDSIDANTYFQMNIQNEVFVLIAFSIGALLNEISTDYQDELEYNNINLFALDNVFMEIMSEYPCYKVEDGQLLLYLLYLDKAQIEHWNSNGFLLTNKICDLFSLKLSVPLTAAISSTIENFNHIHILYSDVMDALEYKSIIGESGVINTSDLKGTGMLMVKDNERMQYLSDAVGEGNYEQAKKIILDVFEEHKTNTALPFPVFRILAMNYLNTVLNSFYVTVIDYTQYHKLLVSNLEPLTTSSDYTTLYNNFCKLLSLVCIAIRTQNEGTDNKLIEQIEKYIYTNYQNNNLNISTIAEAMERNPRYISRIFKIQTGEGLLDYINKVRIKSAKKIMEQEEITIEELAGRVGYTNDRTFRRAFARTEGTPPSKYSPTNWS